MSQKSPPDLRREATLDKSMMVLTQYNVKICNTANSVKYRRKH